MPECLLRNSHINTTVQKDGVQGMQGCIEHTRVVTKLIRKARENPGDLSVIGLTSPMPTYPFHINL